MNVTWLLTVGVKENQRAFTRLDKGRHSPIVRRRLNVLLQRYKLWIDYTAHRSICSFSPGKPCDTTETNINPCLLIAVPARSSPFSAGPRGMIARGNNSPRCAQCGAALCYPHVWNVRYPSFLISALFDFTRMMYDADLFQFLGVAAETY